MSAEIAPGVDTLKKAANRTPTPSSTSRASTSNDGLVCPFSISLTVLADVPALRAISSCVKSRDSRHARRRLPTFGLDRLGNA